MQLIEQVMLDLDILWPCVSLEHKRLAHSFMFSFIACTVIMSDDEL